MFAALLAGCYQPAAEATCSVRCPSGVCPSGMTCGGDGLCRSSPGDKCDVINDAGGGDDGGKLCFGHGFIRDFCVTPPTTPRQFGTEQLSTLTSNCSETHEQLDGTTLCFFVYTSIVFSGTLRVTGPNPAVFVGVGDVTVAPGGAIDVSSKSVEVIAGAGGGEAKGCTPAQSLAGTGDSKMIAGSGGAGGSFTGNGGTGGDANYVDNTVAVNIPGGLRGIAFTPTTVRGGCPGGPGGKGAIAGSFPQGGLGGGAVYLFSRGIVRVHGAINASGAGGGAPSKGGGGGGGGTGGFIGLDAPNYDLVNAIVFAVGGSGASGANAAVDGTAGKEPMMPMSAGPTPAPIGAGAGGGGADFGLAQNGDNGTDGGGGGGGGGKGFIGFAGSVPMEPTARFAPAPEIMEQ
jgi:hypothetical protein